jgi:predicted MFS family arabinose efflux permease
MLVGPIIAPLIGGGLAQVFTWRATFVLLVIVTVPIIIAAYIVLPETQHWFVSERINAENDLIMAQNALFGNAGKCGTCKAFLCSYTVFIPIPVLIAK